MVRECIKSHHCRYSWSMISLGVCLSQLSFYGVLKLAKSLVYVEFIKVLLFIQTMCKGWLWEGDFRLSLFCYIFSEGKYIFCDCNGTRTHNQLVRKRTLNHLAKLASLAKRLSVRLRIKWLWLRVPLQSLKLQLSCLFRARSSLTFGQLHSVDSLINA